MMKRYHLFNQCREGKKSKVNSLCSFERGHSEVEGNSLRECFMTLEEEDSHILSVIRPVALRVCFKWLERKFYFSFYFCYLARKTFLRCRLCVTKSLILNFATSC